MALTTQTRCYSFDQSLRERNRCLSIDMMNKNCIIFPDRVVSTALPLLCETFFPPQDQEQGLPAAVRGLGTTDVMLHCCSCWCCSPVLLLLWLRTHTRTVPLTSGWRVYIKRRGTHAQQAGPHIYRPTVTERRRGKTQLATYYYSWGSPQHQQGVGPPARC